MNPRQTTALAVLILLAVSIISAAAVFPGAIPTDANLPRVANTAQTTLATTVTDTATTIVLTSGTNFLANMVVTIGSERILLGSKSTNTFTGSTRGYDGSTAAAHTSGAAAYGYMVAANLNNALDEIKAIATSLGVNLANVPAGAGLLKFSCTGTPPVCTAYDNTATTGVTRWVFRAGAGQNNQIIQILDNTGTMVSGADADGTFNTYSAGTRQIVLSPNSVGMANAVCQNWKSGSNYDTGSIDTGFCRNAAGVVEINNGAAGTYRDLKLRNLQATTRAEPTCDSTSRGTHDYVAGGAGVADTYRLCMKDAADAYAWTPVN